MIDDEVGLKENQRAHKRLHQNETQSIGSLFKLNIMDLIPIVIPLLNWRLGNGRVLHSLSMLLGPCEQMGLHLPPVCTFAHFWGQVNGFDLILLNVLRPLFCALTLG